MKTKIVATALTASMLAIAGVSAAQAQDAPPHHRGPGMMADANHDGIITRAEMLAGVDAHFAKVDSNGDGFISAEERAAMHAAMRERMAERRAERPDRPDRPRREGRRGARMQERMLARVDANKDGKVSREEARTVAIKRFERIDANGDGQIDQAERQAMREKRGDRRGRHAPPPATAPGE